MRQYARCQSMNQIQIKSKDNSLDEEVQQRFYQEPKMRYRTQKIKVEDISNNIYSVSSGKINSKASPISHLGKFQKDILKQNQAKVFSKTTVKESQQSFIDDSSTTSIKKYRTKQPLMSKSNFEPQILNPHQAYQFGNGKTPNSLFISSWNINGLQPTSSQQNLKNYIKHFNPDIICLNEIKIGYEKSKEIIEKGGFSGYKMYWNFNKNSEGYSGVSIWSKYVPINVSEDLPQKQHSQEGRVLTLEFEKFYLVTCYFPNSGKKLQRLNYRVKNWDKCFQQYCNKLKTIKTTIICGDLNVCHQQIDISRPNQNLTGFTKQQRQGFSNLLTSGWVDTFRHFYPSQKKYTSWGSQGIRSKSIGQRLDYFLINRQSLDQTINSQINNQIQGSDHCPIQLNVLLS